MVTDREGLQSAAAGGESDLSYRWQSVNEHAEFAARDGAGAIVMNERMWLLGGWNPDDKEHFPKICNSEVWSSGDGTKWLLETHAPWEGRHYAGYVVHNGRMWVVGGDANQGHYQNDVWSSADGLQWHLVTDSVPWGPRVLHYCVACGGRIWIMGGQTLPPHAPAVDVYYNDVWSSYDGATWTRELANAPWSPRGMMGGSVVFNDEIWLFGGGTYSTAGRPIREYGNEVWHSADAVNWQQEARAPWAPRQFHDVAVFDGNMWICEGVGKDGKNRRDVWFSADGKSWQELPDTPWAPRHAASVFVHANALWMVAGNNMTPDVWKLTRA